MAAAAAAAAAAATLLAEETLELFTPKPPGFGEYMVAHWREWFRLVFQSSSNFLFKDQKQPINATTKVFNISMNAVMEKSTMEGPSKMTSMGKDFESRLMGRIKENEDEGRSENDNLEGASSDDQHGTHNKRKKRYHRHTRKQIKMLEDYFVVTKHPNKQQRMELAKKLSLDVKQVKFWFQNRRTQLKAQVERFETNILKRQCEELVIDYIRMKEAMRNPICGNCGGPAILGNISIEEHHPRVENAILKDELSRISALANKFLGRPISSLASSISAPMSNSSLELTIGRTGFSGFTSLDTTFPTGLIDSKDGILNVLPPTTPTVSVEGVDVPFEKSIFLELALCAMDELVKLSQIDDPLWVRSLDGGREVLNDDEYTRICPPCIGTKPNGFVTEATRATGVVCINSLALVDSLMDANQWVKMFPNMIGRSSVIDVIFSGLVGSRTCSLQLMHAEFQSLLPSVPVRSMKFLRFCRQHAEGVWGVVDVSVDGIQEFSDARSTFVSCRRLPSGCIVQDLSKGYSKVTCVEHSEYDESVVHHLYRRLRTTGMCFGAQRWLSSLQRHCECSAILSSYDISTEDHTGLSQIGRRSTVKLAQRMTRSFCAGICSTLHTWQLIQDGNTGEKARLMIRNSVDNSGEPPGIVLSATTSVWMPVSQQLLFDFLRNEQMRSEWDELSDGGPIQEMVRITKGRDSANYVSLLRATSANTNQNTMLLLQETQSDASGSLVVYTAVDILAMQAVMTGGDSATVAILPSGFTIVPDGFPDSAGPSNRNNSLVRESGSGSGNGSLLTVGFQMLINNAPLAELTKESIDNISKLISRTIQRIKAALSFAA
ncbi:homeobox-leucine zipper protein ANTHOCYANINLESS 2-like [Actinidia eriantha]|uniref:homeobox-leucine zipper protein ANTHOCYANINLESS 2-like n=1 Tax=Actinidia eriantha TaxID=165200 RepID=UPI0025891D5D|nr:homeobox-leucine zipper protein ANTHOCYANINLESS 2-like [Actinidia eriantha]